MRRGVLEGAARLSPLQTSREGVASPFPLAKEKPGGGGSVSACRGRQEGREGHRRSGRANRSYPAWYHIYL